MQHTGHRAAHIDATATPFPEKYLVARAGPLSWLVDRQEK